ncbi:MAG TPA: ABC transporter permease [Symbiobacteriaceae bacterium]|jgi:ABC-2 type transport system permease protein
MRAMFAIALLQVRLVLKNKGYLILMFAMPLIFTGIFALTIGGSRGPEPFPLAVVDNDGSFAAQELIAALRTDDSLKLQTVAGGQVDVLFADHKVAAGLVISRGFGQAIEAGATPQLQVITAPGGNLHLSVRPAIARAAAGVAQNYRLALRLAGGADPSGVPAAYARVLAERRSIAVGQVATTEGGAAGRDGAEFRERALGLIVMFVMMVVLMMSGVILQERQSGTWGRILGSPIARMQVLGGYLLSFFLTGLLQFTVLVCASALLFKVYWGPLLPLAVMAAAVILCAGGLGLFLAGVVRTPEQQRTIGMLVVIATSLLGGVYWPLDLMSSTMQKIGHLTPQAWAMDGLREVMLRGADWAGLALPLAVLVGMTLALTAAGISRIRWE